LVRLLGRLVVTVERPSRPEADGHVPGVAAGLNHDLPGLDDDAEAKPTTARAAIIARVLGINEDIRRMVGLPFASVSAVFSQVGLPAASPDTL
jgi:hypothetical protein